MDRGLHEAFACLTEALQYTRDKNIESITPCLNYYHMPESGDREWVKEVAEITYRSGRKIYADIGGDANTAAMYDTLAVICGLKAPSSRIERIEYIEEVEE
ncbi:MAG: hypothetical protein IKF90_13685 [Parasporobacterium sp.]|nr:hypothetical protein [Parasporobacterium sp.]